MSRSTMVLEFQNRYQNLVNTNGVKAQIFNYVLSPATLNRLKISQILSRTNYLFMTDSKHHIYEMLADQDLLKNHSGATIIYNDHDKQDQLVLRHMLIEKGIKILLNEKIDD